MYFVYILQSVKFPQKLYTGFSENTYNRLIDHNNGNSAHTNKFKPWKIIFYCAFENKAIALNFEKY